MPRLIPSADIENLIIAVDNLIANLDPEDEGVQAAEAAVNSVRSALSASGPIEDVTVEPDPFGDGTGDGSGDEEPEE